ncbi:mediator complex, subunit Med18 [Xylariaceae sp. FL0804]|nr:mediator complex, subunit Med18 [Xylariaceae sp. FL0804]
MRELFLMATVRADDFENACAVLQGLTWMKARRTSHRILYFAGLPQPLPRGLPKTRTFQASRALPLWRELGQHLTRSSYILQTAYEVSPDAHFGTGAPMHFNMLPGLLRWTDVPDPLRDSPVTSRRKIEIPDQRNLILTMRDNEHTYVNELIEESVHFVRDDVEFVFSRYYHLPDPPPERKNEPIEALPAWIDLRPVDPAQKWVLHVKLEVAEESQPEKTKEAQERLMATKAELDKLFHFRPIDRLVFDTRISPHAAGNSA